MTLSRLQRHANNAVMLVDLFVIAQLFESSAALCDRVATTCVDPLVCALVSVCASAVACWLLDQWALLSVCKTRGWQQIWPIIRTLICGKGVCIIYAAGRPRCVGRRCTIAARVCLSVSRGEYCGPGEDGGIAMVVFGLCCPSYLVQCTQSMTNKRPQQQHSSATTLLLRAANAAEPVGTACPWTLMTSRHKVMVLHESPQRKYCRCGRGRGTGVGRAACCPQRAARCVPTTYVSAFCTLWGSCWLFGSQCVNSSFCGVGGAGGITMCVFSGVLCSVP